MKTDKQLSNKFNVLLFLARQAVVAVLIIVVSGGGCVGKDENFHESLSETNPCFDSRSVTFLESTRFEREIAGPNTESRDFSVPFDGTFCVHLINGVSDPPHGNRISSAEIGIDDVTVFFPDDFNQRVSELEKVVALSEGDHSLNVQLRSVPGSFVEISIRGVPEPGIPFSLQIFPEGRISAPSYDESAVEIQVFDINNAPVSGIEVRLDLADLPIESGGMFLANSALDHISYSAPFALGSLTAVTDSLGTALAVVNPRGEGIYNLLAAIPAAPYIEPVSFWIEAVPNPGQWIALTPILTDYPSARAQPNMMFDTNRRRVLLYGGREPSGTVFNDLWALDLHEDPAIPPTTWVPITSVGVTPPEVGGTSAVYVPSLDRIILMTSDQSDSFQVWQFQFDPSGLSGSWSVPPVLISPDNELPIPIKTHLFGSAVYDPIRNRMIHFGGITLPQDPPDYGITKDIIILDLSGFYPELTALTPTEPISQRSLAGTVFDVKRNRMIVYGGHYQYGPLPPTPVFLGDAWQADFRNDPLGEWQELHQVAGNPVDGMPDNRRNCSFANDVPRERAVMYGGLMAPPEPEMARPATDEVWQMRYHVDGEVIWDKLVPEINGWPTRRDGHSAGAVFDFDTARMIVFGGIRPESGPPGDLLFDETWELNWDYRPIFEGVIIAEFDHWAIYNDGVDGATLKVFADPLSLDPGVAVTNVSVRLAPPVRDNVFAPGPVDPVLLNGITFVPLSDNGTLGDDVAGDGIYHLGPITYSGTIPVPELPLRVDFRVYIELSDGTSVLETARFNAVEAGTVISTTPVVDAVPPEFTVSRSSNALFITDPFRLFFLNYRNLTEEQLKTGLKEVTSFAYLFLEDRYHFVTVMPTRWLREATSIALIRQRSFSMQKPAQHIGFDWIWDYDCRPQYCCGAPPGSCMLPVTPCNLCNELLSVTYIHGPVLRVFLHETVHAWAARFGSSSALSDLGDRPISNAQYHWNPESDIRSVMTDSPGGAIILDVNPDRSGTFCPEVHTNLHPYDLYVMGLIPSSSLPDVNVMVDPVYPTGDCMMTPGAFSDHITYSAAYIVAQEGGERIPAAGTVTAFNNAMIAVTPDSSFTPAEIAFFELLASFFASNSDWIMIDGMPEYPFEAATDFQGTLDSNIVLKIP